MPAERPPSWPKLDLSALRKVRPRDYLVRFAFGAVISISVALLAQAGGARLGGLFLAFPAILPAGLTLIQEEEGDRDADRSAVGAILGGVSLSVFAVVAEAVFRPAGGWVALVVATAAWCAAAFALYALLATVRPDACDVNKD